MKKARNRNKTALLAVILICLAIAFTWAVFRFDQYMNDTGDAANIEAEQEERGSEILDVFVPDQPEAEIDVEEESTEEASDTFPYQTEVDDLTITVWIPVWDFTAGLTSLQNKNDRIDTISPVWYSLNPDGSLVDRRNARWSEVVASKGDARLVPSIAISDPEILSQVLSNQTSFDNQINSIMYEVNTYGYDGIDIDYEMIYIKNKDSFRAFIEQLRAKLNENGKILSLTVLPQWGKDTIYTAFPETRAVQDYTWAGSAADEVRIMTYDYTSAGSAEPGPVAPITWIENVLIYATEEIPREKLILGIHLYGYQWSNTSGVKAKTFTQVEALRSIPDYVENHDSTYEEGVATYTCPEGGSCTLFFQDEEGVAARKEMAAKYGIRGVTFWRLGGEGDLL